MLKDILLKRFGTQLTANNAIITLGDTDDSGKGKRFKSRFIQAGIAGYPEQFGNVLIKKETFDKFINTIVGAPVIINHKDITKDNADSERVGVVSNVWFDERDGWYWCDGVIWDETAQDLINKGWSVSCSYDVLKADDKGGSENNIPYDMEFLDGVFTHLALVDNPRYERANIVFNSKTVISNGGDGSGNFNHDGRPGEVGGSLSQKKSSSDYLKSERVYDNFIKTHYDLKLVEEAPEKYTGKTVKEICEYLGIADNKPAIIKTPKDKVIINQDHIVKLVGLNEPSRKEFLNYTLRTLQAPNLILKNGEKNKYIKLFNENNETKPHLQIVKVKNDGSFYVTNYRPTKSQVVREINEGQVIYDLSNVRDAKTSANNIINDNNINFNPNHEEILSTNNDKEQDMALLEDLKKLITKAENSKGDEMDKENEIQNEKVDKRKLIDEVGGILKGKVDEEVWRTIIGKIEKIGYSESEAGTADNKCKNEADDEKEDNKKVENESEEDKKEVKELKEEMKKDSENKKVENSKTDYFEKMNEIYNSQTSDIQKTDYVSREEKLRAAEEYFG